MTCRSFVGQIAMSNITYSWKVIGTAVAMVLVAVSVRAQHDQGSEYDNCETIAWKLEHVGGKFVAVGESDLLFILGGGSNETDDRNRISLAKSFIVRKFDVPREKIITSVGYGDEEKPTAAYVRFYLNGKLLNEIRASPRSTLCHNDSGEFDIGV